MRGSPLARALIVFAALLCAAPALWKLTTVDASAPAPVQSAATAEQDISLELAFTTVPARVSITHLSKKVWEKDRPESTEEVALKIPWPKEGGELVFDVEWPEGSPLSAMRAKLNDPERGEIERTLWGRTSKKAVLGFP